MRCDRQGNGGIARHGQIAMFFMIGLVLLFTVAIFYLMVGGEEQPQEDFANDVLNSYIASCVDSTVEREFRELGETGGIWREAPGYEFGTVGDKEVLYGITARRESDNARRQLLPMAYGGSRYPADGLRLSDTELMFVQGEWVPLFEFQDGYFGQVNFPGLCRLGDCRHYFGLPEVPGIKNGAGQEVSVEEMLEERLTTKMELCINEQAFTDYLNKDVTRRGTPAVDVTFTDRAVLLGIGYALSIDGHPQEVSFEPRYTIRYLALAQYAADLAREETRNISFRMEDDYNHLPSYRDGFKVAVVRDADGGEADLVTITDEQSVIMGKRYEFRFLVQHRPPMLDWITKEQAYASAPDCNGPAGPIAIDPDGQDITCGGAGETFVVSDTDLEKDCLTFDGDGNPIPGSDAC